MCKRDVPLLGRKWSEETFHSMVCGTCSDYVAKVRERHDSEAKPFLFLVREAHTSALRFVFHGSGDAGAFRRDVG